MKLSVRKQMKIIEFNSCILKSYLDKIETVETSGAAQSTIPLSRDKNMPLLRCFGLKTLQCYHE